LAASILLQDFINQNESLVIKLRDKNEESS
jgi:hypothetical protein